MEENFSPPKLSSIPVGHLVADAFATLRSCDRMLMRLWWAWGGFIDARGDSSPEASLKNSNQSDKLDGNPKIFHAKAYPEIRTHTCAGDCIDRQAGERTWNKHKRLLPSTTRPESFCFFAPFGFCCLFCRRNGNRSLSTHTRARTRHRMDESERVGKSSSAFHVVRAQSNVIE